MFLQQEAGAFRNNIEKKPQKPHLKLKSYLCYIFTDNICCVGNPMQSVFFLQKFINFVEGGLFVCQKYPILSEEFELIYDIEHLDNKIKKHHEPSSVWQTKFYEDLVFLQSSIEEYESF